MEREINNKRYSLKEESEEKHLIVSEHVLTENIPVHWHSYFEIEIVKEGAGTHYFNNTEHKLERGVAYILNPTDFHRILPDGEITLLNLSFDEEILSERTMCELSSGECPRIFELSDDIFERILSLAEIILLENNEEGGGASHGLCESLLSILLRQNAERKRTEGEHARGIRKALIYLDTHFRERPTLDDIARVAGFHPNYFSEIFKRVTGESYSQRLNALRTGHAKMLLSKGCSVSETCSLSGFGSLSNFLTVFKKQTGLSPKEYRKQNI